MYGVMGARRIHMHMRQQAGGMGSNPVASTKIRNPYSKTILRTFTFIEIILKWVLTNTLCGSGNLPADREEPVRYMD